MKRAERLKKAIVDAGICIRDAMKRLNESSTQILLVSGEHGELLGTITDGDIRRALLADLNLGISAEKIMNRDPVCLYEDERDQAMKLMKERVINQIPILSRHGKITELVLRRDFDDCEPSVKYQERENIVFILAGGKGTRLDPFTKVIPKPLIPMGEKTIIEIVMERFHKYGFNDFVISVNYKAEMIKMYFAENSRPYNIDYVQEREFLGTAGSLSLIKGRSGAPVLVSNCDVLVDVDFHDLLGFHLERKASFTVVGAMKHVKIPYGILRSSNGRLKEIEEKPEFDFMVSAGVYVVDPEMIDMLNPSEYMDMPNLIQKGIDAGRKVAVYPIGSGKWMDIGQWDEYKKALEHFKEVL